MIYSRAAAQGAGLSRRRSAASSLILLNEKTSTPPRRRWAVLRMASSSSGSSVAAATAAAGFICVSAATVVAAVETSSSHQHHQPHHQQHQHHHRSLYSSRKTLMEAPKKNGRETGSEEASRRKKESSVSSFWETLVTDVKEMKKNLDDVMSDVNDLLKPPDDKPTTSRRAKEASSSPLSSSSSPSSSSSHMDSLASLGSTLLKLLVGGGRDDDKVSTAEEIIQRARENSASAAFQHENDVSNSQQDGSTLLSVLQILDAYKDKLDQVADLYMGSIDVTKISPTALYYYVEHEDEVKNPSWKRRMHRYYPGIDVSKMQEINDSCDLAFMAYANEVVEIQEALEHFRTPYALVSANVVSQPGKPASFLAVKKLHTDDDSLSSSSSPLEVLLCVRGTKTIADAITDVICNVEPYRGGTAHALILQSGQYLAQKYAPLLHQLLTSSGKSSINLTLIGHSMGAGAATIAGIELGEDDTINVQQVVGFGCPALLSKDLAEKVSPFVSTIINDNDMIPRMSGVSAANLLMKIMQFDWLPYAKRDVRHAVEELNRSQPLLFNPHVCDTILGLVEPFLDHNLVSATTGSTKNHSKNATSTGQQQQQLLPLEPELFPPGQCIHFYRDGIGVSVNVVPNTFFGEIDFNRRMLDDHLIHNGYQQIFLDLMRQQKKDHHYKFDGPANQEENN